MYKYNPQEVLVKRIVCIGSIGVGLLMNGFVPLLEGALGSCPRSTMRLWFAFIY